MKRVDGRWRERAAKGAAAILVAVAIGAPTGSAEARCSLPYVEDVSPNNSGYVAQIGCAGSAKCSIKVTCEGKRVKAERAGKRLWAVKMRKGASYRLSVKAKGGEWKSIVYRICR